MAEVAKGIIDIEINTGSAASQLQALQSQINAFSLALNKNNATQGKFAAKYSKELQDAINKTGIFTAETVRLSTAAATLDKTLSKGKTSLGQYFSARFNKDGAMAAETLALAGERARRLQTQFIATSAASNGFQEALAVRPLAAFSSEAAVAAQRTQLLSNMFKQGTTQLINFGKNVQWAGRQLMVGFTVPLTIFGSVAGKTFMELEKQVVGFKKVYGDLFTTPADLEKNLEAVKGLASEYTKYGIAVKDTIGLAAEAAAAGRQGAELTDAVTQATRLATLGQMDQNAALETTISLQSAFKLSGQDLADTINFLNMVENQTVVTLQDIANAIPRVAPVIAGLGGDVKDLTVFLAAMQEGGVNANEGANALKSGLASLINPTKQATAMLSGFGINLETIIQTNKGDLMGTVQSFAQALASLDQFSRQQALEQVFGKFQYAKLGALFDNITREGSQAQQVIETMAYSTEQLASTADKELKTIEESFGVQLTGAVERFKLAIAPIGEIFVKIAIPLVNFATTIAEAFNGLSDGQKKFAAIGAVVIGVVVPAVTMLTGLFLNLVGTLAKMTQGMSLFFKGLITGGPIGAIKALTQSSKYLSLAEMDAAMAAQQLAGSSAILNKTLAEQAITGNAAAAAIGNLTRAYGAMIATQGAAAGAFPGHFGVAGAAGARAKASQVVIRGVQKRNSGGPIFMSNGTTVPGTGNTDTVPAMLTPGEFVVNKEATKNNLGLLHSINNSKKPQGLNAGGKAKGVQYLNDAGQVREADLTDADIDNLNRFDNDNTPAQPRRRDSQVAQRAQPADVKYSSEIPANLLRRFPGSGPIKPIDFQAHSFLHMQRNVVNSEGSAKLSGPRYMDMALRGSNLTPTQEANAFVDRLTGYKGARVVGNIGFTASSVYNKGTHAIQDLIDDLNYRILYGENPYEGTMKAAGLSGTELETAKSKVHSQVVGKLRAMQHAGQVTFNANDSKQMSGVYKVMERAVEKSLRVSGVGEQGINALYFGGEKNVPEFKFRPGISKDAIRKLPSSPDYKFILPDSPEGIELGLRTKDIILKRPGFDDVMLRAGGSNQHKNINSQLLREAFTALATRGRSLRMNSGGQVPGMQYFAANNRQRVVQEAYNAASGIRRRVRPGRDQRFSQQAVLKDYVHDANFIRNSKDPEDMNTLIGMLKPLTQQTRATRGTVLGSTNNPELPYAQQKRIVAAIKEGRYEDLFGMKLNFRGPGSYTTRRETDFSPFIGDLSNPTLKSFSNGFMTLKSQKEEIAQLRKLIRSGKFKKLTPGTAEYARALGMTGLWSPARSFRPGANPTIGSDWTIEQVLANRTRDYNNRKKGLNKAFPDKKIQQLLIDEMVGSGTLALDVQKAFYKHPRLPYRGDHIENLVKKENEILLGNRTSQITGVATDLRTRLPSLITQSGARGYNKGGMIPGVQYLNSGARVLKLLQDKKQFGFMSNPSANPFAFDAAFLTGTKGSDPAGTWARTLGGSKNPTDTLEFLFSNDETKSTVLPMIGAMLVNARSKGVGGLSPSTSLSADSSSLVKKLQDRGILGREYSSEITNAYDKADAGSQIAQAVRTVSGQIDSGLSIGKNYHALLPKDIDTFGEIARMLLRSKGKENISQEEATMIMNEIIKRGTLDDFLKSESAFKNLLLNSGNIVPGIGNTDTVPAMLTPGEFVVNKESTKKNYDLLTAINDGQLPKFNKGGKIPGVQYLNDGKVVKYFSPKDSKGADGSPDQQKRNSKVAGRATGLGMVGSIGVGTAGFMLAEKAGIDSMAGQFAASMAAGMVAQKALAAATIKMSKNTMTAAEKTKALAPMLSKIAPSLAKFALPLTFGAAALVGVGITLYKLNKSLVKSEKAGAELSEAMYGSAKTTKAMGEAFGRETYASAALKKAAEKSGGQEISQEAVATSGEFMKSDAAKGIVEDIKLVQKSGGDAVLALRNQLASSIIAGVISPEEARAIALDVGKELGSATLGVQVSGELTSLIGPNGEKILDNIIEITAEISPKIDATKIQKDAQGAFDSLNPGEKFIQFFKGGQESFIENFSIDQISSANASALAKEAEARSLLNLAYQEGAITLKEYLDAEGKITSGSNERSKFVEDANAQALGFSSLEDMNSALDSYIEMNKKESDFSNELSRKIREEGYIPTPEDKQRQQFNPATVDPQGKKAYDAIITKSRDTLKQSFIDSGMDEGMATTKIEDMYEVSQIDPRIFEKLSSGQMPLQSMDVLVNLQSTGDLQPEDIDRIGKELTALTTIPKIDKVINFETANEEMITEAYDAYVALEEQPEIFKGIRIEDNLAKQNMEQFGINYDWIMSLPNQEKFIVLTTIERHVKLQEAAKNGDVHDRLALGQSNADMAKLKENTVDFEGTQDFSPPPPGGGGSGKQTLKGYIKEFKDATKEKMDYFKATNHILGTAKQEALALIDTEMYLKANKKQRAELIKLAEKQLNIQRATAFLSMSAEEKTLLSLEMQEKALDKKSQKEEKALRAKQRQMELNDRALEDLAEKEDAVNEAYDARFEALDKVSEANDRIAEQDRSRISLASALASGDIAAAANAASEMQQQNAQYQIEDTRAALEEQRQRDLESLTVSVNGKLMTRNELEAANKAIQAEVEVIQDTMFNLETERLTLAEKRADAELRTFLLQQKQTIEALKLKEINGELTKAQKGYLKTLMVDFKNLSGVDYNQYKKYGGSIAKMAFGGVAYKGSTESPPALRMNYGSTVPGIGMTDKVPAMLTPGEFVIRKSVADKNRPFLDALNSQVFPGVGGSKSVPTNNFLDGIGSPRYAIPESSISDIPVNSPNVVSTSSPMYNSTYNVNVNVSGTNASPDDIANVVMAKLSQQNRGNLRSSRY
jgi:TP901 family phage tail tape measure protein